jgi:hypothetical protein
MALNFEEAKLVRALIKIITFQSSEGKEGKAR